jgi:hypothetical protein
MVKKAQLAKLKAKMPTPPSQDAGDDSDMFQMDEKEHEEPEAGEPEEYEGHEGQEQDQDQDQDLDEESGLPEGAPEEEAMESEDRHTAELSDDALLREIQKRGLMAKAAKMTGAKKAVAVSPDDSDVEAETGY